jgi:hypothetical protein
MVRTRYAFALVGVLALVAGCAPDRIPVAAASSSSAHAIASRATPVRCSGAGGEPIMHALFDDLSVGRPPDVGAYFVEPIDFVRWWDPTLPSGQVITFEAGPGSGAVTLDTLRGHLAALTRRGLQATISGFTANGYESVSKAETGGGFTFDLHGRIGGKGAFVDGGGGGMIDCLTGKLKTIVIDNW